MTKIKKQSKPKKNNYLKYIQIALAVVLVALIVIIIIAPTKNKSEKNPIKENKKEEIYFLGGSNAPLTITEYSSITCSFCKRYEIDDQTFENIKKEYVDTGKVKYVFKHFTRNNTDIKAATAIECAGEQEMFFEYKKKLFENQSELGKEDFTKYAKELNLDIASFEKCIKENKYLTKIENQKQEGIQKGINGTPGFVVGNTLVSGAQSYQYFKMVIDKQLQG